MIVFSVGVDGVGKMPRGRGHTENAEPPLEA